MSEETPEQDDDEKAQNTESFIRSFLGMGPALSQEGQDLRRRIQLIGQIYLHAIEHDLELHPAWVLEHSQKHADFLLSWTKEQSDMLEEREKSGIS